LKGVIIFPEVFISIFFYEYINFCTVFFFPAGTTNDPEKGKQKMKMETDEDNDESNEEKATSSRIKTEE
jgi:hypothetical protein